jgi:glycosyltransferase involved in cell wall biosynthesis
MANVVGTLTRAATRRDNEPLNILTFPTHERYQSQFAEMSANFYLVRAPQVKDWNPTYATVPDNHILLDPALGEKQIPAHVDFDLVLSQNKFGQYQLAQQIARSLQLPLVSLEHTLPHPDWSRAKIEAMKQLRGDINVFISEYSVEQWGWRLDDPSVQVVHHAVNTDVFSPKIETSKNRHILSVVNDWINRDWCCGYSLWREVVDGLPTHVLGDTPGLSSPAPNVAGLALAYAMSAVFLNTSLISPVPTALLEAMSCGCAVVSTATCMIPSIIENGVNGFISNDPAELRRYCELLLDDPKLQKKLGQAARETITQRFSIKQFLGRWEAIFRHAAEMAWTGEKHENSHQCS